MFSPPRRGGKYTAVLPQGFVRGTFPFVTNPLSSASRWRSVPANLLTFCNMGSGALVAWWAASEFDLGWAAAEWAASIGMDGRPDGLLGTTERRVMGIGWMLIVWLFGQLCDVLDGPVARKMGASGDQGAWLDSMADLVSSGTGPGVRGVVVDVGVGHHRVGDVAFGFAGVALVDSAGCSLAACTVCRRGIGGPRRAVGGPGL